LAGELDATGDGSAKSLPGGGRSDFAAPRSAGLRSARAQRALPHLTRRICLSAVSEANVASYAARPKTEHRRGVGPAGDDRGNRSGDCCPAATLPARWPRSFASLRMTAPN